MNLGRTCKSNIYLRTSIFLPAHFVSSPHILRLQISKSERWKSATYSSFIDDHSSYFKRSVQESRSIPSHKTKPQSQPKVALILALWKFRIPNPAHLLLTVPLESLVSGACQMGGRIKSYLMLQYVRISVDVHDW